MSRVGSEELMYAQALLNPFSESLLRNTYPMFKRNGMLCYAAVVVSELM